MFVSTDNLEKTLVVTHPAILYIFYYISRSFYRSNFYWIWKICEGFNTLWFLCQLTYKI